MRDDQQPDSLAKGVRFVCGFVAGGLVGFIGAIVAQPDSPRIAAGSGMAAALVFGLLAVRYGDRFWYGLRHLFWFWP